MTLAASGVPRPYARFLAVYSVQLGKLMLISFADAFKHGAISAPRRMC
jgi:hypothetical protein